MRNLRARRYILRLRRDGVIRVTVPRYGTEREARQFAERNATWIQAQLQKPRGPKPWTVEADILLGGNALRVADLVSAHESPPGTDFRPMLEKRWREVATRLLPVRTVELAASHGFTFRRVMVRNQRSRWGSCSARGTISLNWRLVQTPDFVRDYIILHELAHLREMNHSHRFWREVERVCPAYREAEAWLKAHSRLLAE